MTEDAVLGRSVFARAGCAECHSGTRMTDSALDVFHDVGTLKATSGNRRSEPLAGLDTPTVRGVWASAPYLHDGSAATLEQVIANPEHGRGSQLSDAEKHQLVSFLLQLENEPLGPVRANVEPKGGCRAVSGDVTRAPWWLFVAVAFAWLRRRRVYGRGGSE
jgi:MYXO-CTERM domain-containing protein